MRKEKSSKYKGVHWCNTDKRWKVSFCANGKNYSFGNYKSEEEANNVYLREYAQHGVKYDPIIDLNGEIWVNFEIHGRLLGISNKGRIRSYNYKGSGNEKLLLQQINPFGYYTIGVNGHTVFVHKLVAKYFIGDSELTVNHKDGNKLNNDVSNLEYISNRANVCHDLIRRDKLIGAHYRKRDGYWVSEIKIGNDRIWLGAYKTQIDAHRSYMDALLRYNLIDEYNYLINLMRNGIEK